MSYCHVILLLVLFQSFSLILLCTLIAQTEVQTQGYVAMKADTEQSISLSVHY